MNRQRYRQIVESFAHTPVLVLGDLMLDEYVRGRATRISPESPVMVVEVDEEDSVPGGAANVANNLLRLGACVSAVGVVGRDEAGRRLVSALGTAGVDTAGIVEDGSRPTTRKTRIVAHAQQVLRIDRERTEELPDRARREMLRRLQAQIGSVRAVLVSDYGKGVVSPAVAESVVAACRAAGTMLTANPKPAIARSLRGADVLSLNQPEAEAVSGDRRFGAAERIEAAGRALADELGVGTLVVTRGPKGLSLWQAGGRYSHVPAHAVEVYDVAGAGDTAISAMTLALASGAAMDEAAVMANHAAACVIRKVGVATVTPDELLRDWSPG